MPAATSRADTCELLPCSERVVTLSFLGAVPSFIGMTQPWLETKGALEDAKRPIRGGIRYYLVRWE